MYSIKRFVITRPRNKCGHRSLTGKISQFDRQILSPGGHAWPVNFLIKKYVQNWSRFLISNFPKKCMDRLRCWLITNKGGEVTHFVIQIQYTTSIVPKAKGCFPVTRFSHVRRKSLNLLKFHISAITLTNTN